MVESSIPNVPFGPPHGPPEHLGQHSTQQRQLSHFSLLSVKKVFELTTRGYHTIMQVKITPLKLN